MPFDSAFRKSGSAERAVCRKSSTVRSIAINGLPYAPAHWSPAHVAAIARGHLGALKQPWAALAATEEAHASRRKLTERRPRIQPALD